MSLPNGTVPMERTECETCNGPDVPWDLIGLTCGGCGHHFHIGPGVLVETTPIFCPRCEGACPPFDIQLVGEEAR